MLYKVKRKFKVKDKELFKKLLDSRDRDILRLLYNAERSLSGNAIADKVGLSPPAIKPRLEELQKVGLIKKAEEGEMRTFDRDFTKKDGTITTKTLNSPSKIMWTLDLKKEKKTK